MSIKVTLKSGQSEVGCVVPTPELSQWLMSVGEDVSKMNRVVWTAGASRWSDARFLVHQDNAATLSGDPSAVVSITMQDKTKKNAGTVFMDRMFQIEHRPVHTMGSNQLVEVHLVDERYFWQWRYAENSNTNVTRPADRTTIFEVTDEAGDPATWEEFLTRLLNELVISGQTTVTLDPLDVTTPTIPYDYFTDYENAAVMIDRVCAYLGIVFVANRSAGGVSTRYRIATPSAFNDEATHLADSKSEASRDLMAGGITDNAADKSQVKWLDAKMPSQVIVLFPRVLSGLDDQSDRSNPLSATPYKAVVSVAGKPPGVKGRTALSARIYDNTWAIGQPDMETNDEDLTKRANFLSIHFFNRYKIAKQQAVHRGFQAIGLWPGTIIWSLTPVGPFTKTRIPEDWYQYGGNRGVLEGFTNQRIVNSGGLSIARTFDGALHIGMASLSKFPAIITGNAVFGERFKYAWSEAVVGDDTWTIMTAGRSGTTSSGYALNRFETNFTGTFQAGVDTSLGDYTDTTYALRPVGGGGTATTHRIDTPVEMTEEVKTDGTVVYWFSAPVSHDGECS